MANERILAMNPECKNALRGLDVAKVACKREGGVNTAVFTFNAEYTDKTVCTDEYL